ncbi:collagen-binding protein [Flavobacterium psychrophilum]|nr:collagen-binding protein [Flavobacterium psychrophilum]
MVFATNFAQDRFTISGIISDAKNNETLIGVNISSKNTKAFAVTNEYGFYSLTLPKGDYQIAISYVGFQKIEETISLTQNIKKIIVY